MVKKQWRVMRSRCFINDKALKNDVPHKRKERKREIPKVANNNGQLGIANATSGGARKPSGPR